jgi:hypothetical protein
MAIKMSNKAIENQKSIVLNLSMSFCFLLAKAEPIVIKTIADSIKRIWSIPKKAASVFLIPSVKFFQKYFTIGLCT